MTLAPVLAALSESAWVQRERARDAGISVREETLTENLLVALFHLAGQTSVVHKTTQAEESVYGADWLWALRHGNRWLALWVQAKKGDKVNNGVAYKALGDQKALSQGLRLLYRSTEVDAIPIYAFFNFDASPFSNPAPQGLAQGMCPRSPLHRCAESLPWTPCGHAPAPPSGGSALGVTIAPAVTVVIEVLLKGGAPERRATFINQFAMPLECLLCPDWAVAGAANAPDPPGNQPNDDNPFNPTVLLGGVRRLQAPPQDLPNEPPDDRGASPVRGVSAEMPPWAARLLEGQNPFQGQVDQPAYVVVTQPED